MNARIPRRGDRDPGVREGAAMKTLRLGLAAVAALLALALPTVAQANEVTKWNDIAVTTLLLQPPIASQPPAAAVFMATVQGAVYGAANAVDRHGKPYLVDRSFPKASLDAAVATAAFRVIDGTFSAQHATLQAAYDSSLAAIPDGASKNQGIEVGRMAAETMLAQGHFDPVALPCDFGSGPGVFQVLPGQPCDPTQWVAHAVPFLVQSADQFRTAGPYPLTSAAYAKDVNEVESLGAINSAIRTPEQSHIAAFWQSNPAPGYNALGRRFVDQLSLSTRDSALLFAMIDLNAADALINTWNDKYHWTFWRPMAAIRNADTDGNPDTVKDGSWTPLFDPSLPASIGGVGPALITPPFPDHPSGHASVTSATMNAFRSFFGTNEMTFFLTSSRFPGEQRYYSHFSDVTDQVIEARVWAGIHFRHADQAAANLGREVEAYTHEHQFAFAR
jgi:hypothetical protein